MARARINLNRFRKVYPQMSKSPRMFSAELRPYKIVFSNSISETFEIANFISPVVVVSPEDNINPFVHSIIRADNGINWNVTIQTSAPYTGTVHVHVGEAFVL